MDISSEHKTMTLSLPLVGSCKKKLNIKHKVMIPLSYCASVETRLFQDHCCHSKSEGTLFVLHPSPAAHSLLIHSPSLTDWRRTLCPCFRKRWAGLVKQVCVDGDRSPAVGLYWSTSQERAPPRCQICTKSQLGWWLLVGGKCTPRYTAR